jgi:tRNA(Arg) A34 adenosine deaminase TadA
MMIDREQAVEEYIARFATQVDAMKRKAKPYSFQEYSSFAASQALIALQEGNYGVGAVYVYRRDGQEFVFGGRNGIISKKDTHLHAEQDAIDIIESLARGEQTRRDRLLVQRNAPHNNEEKILITSLEPCPMCTVRILTHKINAVYICAPDDIAGSMLEGRENILPILWRDMRNGKVGMQPGESPQPLKVVVPNEANPDNIDYIHHDYKNLSLEIFLSTREAIDMRMGTKGLAPDLSSLLKAIASIIQ